MTDISLMPVKDISKVRGIGVAVIVKKSTFVFKAFRCSLCSTPNLCSSSITTKPKSLNLTSEVNKRCVPITTSTVPSAIPASVSFISLVL